MFAYDRFLRVHLLFDLFLSQIPLVLLVNDVEHVAAGRSVQAGFLVSFICGIPV